MNGEESEQELRTETQEQNGGREEKEIETNKDETNGREESKESEVVNERDKNIEGTEKRKHEPLVGSEHRDTTPQHIKPASKQSEPEKSETGTEERKPFRPKGPGFQHSIQRNRYNKGEGK